MVLASEDGADRLGKRPLARIVATGGAGVDPAYMGIGPIPASRKALERAGLGIEDMDLVEINEAFAAQVLPCMRELGIPHERLNVNGGAIAIGHPFGGLRRALAGHAGLGAARARACGTAWPRCASAWVRGWRR